MDRHRAMTFVPGWMLVGIDPAPLLDQPLPKRSDFHSLLLSSGAGGNDHDTTLSGL
jgi:hypothetical protein